VDKEVSAITKNGVALSIVRLNGRFELTFDDLSNFYDFMYNPLKTEGGITVGEMNYNFIHDMLDEWIDNQLEGGNTNG
jgi:hypothetical protein